mmetsp:Transcript_11216/g.22066  ORF Transcript_11216/g.22066 Transcript_11216/m.22066 type:complete len:304 (+) Transcript_11216:759-1670(+)|eukprot:CAMPEP_0204917050 /NCGR_PEP_ID=MMETSP1397-20131031/14733_1 /ASSEMBLY_ACC=CAM_ASM_000891 /TAXON_ID=49980 /ORGANISM="Climacostomum Climacostomum virens, Strain Stock W-24" /LENGTH=303 /DNA_ID=CAMNT_0052089785 /DNA_START=721 /DNA_END=1632 /DNA_ORIENTATION=+
MIRTSELFSAILLLNQKAIQTIKAVDATGHLNTVNKGTKEKLDPCTDADLRAQQIIVSNLQFYFPELPIVGEERVEADPSAIIPDLDLNLVQPSVIPAGLCELNVDELIVWIDPLDATLEYVQRNLEVVTSLIGVALKGRPIFGAIGLVFSEPQTVYWGGPGMGLFKLVGENAITYEAFDAPKPNKRLIIGSGMKDEKVINFINSLEADTVLKIPGSGFKAIKVILGEIDAQVVPKTSAMKWDACASEALILACSGQYTMMSGDCYNYVIEDSHLLYGGILATRDAELHEYLTIKYHENKQLM